MKGTKNTNENLVYVKFDYSEAVQAKKDLLNSELNLLQLLKNIRKYHILRSEENKKKAKLYRKLKEVDFEITKMERILPKVAIPKITHYEEVIETKEESYNQDIEEELKDIQKRLRSFG